MAVLTLFVVSGAGYGATISNSYSPNALIPIGGSGLYYVSISGVPANAVITNVEAKFDYIAYGVVQNYVSCRFNRGSDPGSAGGVSLVSQGSLPAGNPGTYGYIAFAYWNGQGVNTNYYFRFFTASGSPYPPTINNIYVRVTYELPPSAPTLISPADYSIRYNQTPHDFAWSSVSGADRYRIYVDNNSGFGSPEINSEPTTSSLSSYTSLSNNVYYWKVQARNSVGQWGDWSATRSFVVGTPPPSPSLGSPAGGSQFSQGASVTFNWSGPSGYSINRYYLRIVLGTNINNTPVFEQELSSTSRSITLSSWTVGTYTWAVRAVKNAPAGFNQLIYESAIGWGQYATRTFSVYSLNPSVSVSPTSGPQGTTFDEPGTGFTPNNTADLHFTGPDGPSEVPNKPTDSNGHYSHSWTCNACPAGTYQYWAVDNASGQTSNTVSFAVYVVNPQVSVTPSSGPQGTTFQQPGTGFTPNSTATLNFTGPDGPSTASEATDANGTYTHSWLCNACPAGTYQYYAVDNATGQTSNTVTFTVYAVNPQVSVTPASGSRGTTFQQPGTGFTPNNIATLYFNGPDGPSTFPTKPTDGNGSYDHSWTCDACPLGTYQYWAVDEATGQQSNTVSFSVVAAAAPSLVSPANGASLNASFCSPDTLFDWTDVAGGTEYELQIDDDPTFVSPEWSINNSANQPITISQNTLGIWLSNGTWYWRVRVVDSPNWSETRSFTYTMDEEADPILVPLYRLYHPGPAPQNDHFYATNPAERDDAVANSGYTYEKIESYISDRPFIGGTPLYRLYKGAGENNHVYVQVGATRNSKIQAGYTYEGIAGYVASTSFDWTIDLYHLRNDANGDDFYTTNATERDYAVANFGYTHDASGTIQVAPVPTEELLGKPAFAGIYGGFLNTANGNFIHGETDLAHRSGKSEGLRFERTYNSYGARVDGPLGYGWSHSYQLEIVDEAVLVGSGPNGFVRVGWPDGHEDVYTYTETGSEYFGLVEPATRRVKNTLLREPGQYQLVTLDHANFLFELVESKSEDVVRRNVYRIQKITDRNGHETTFSYDPTTGKLTAVTGPAGRSLTFSYIGDHIQAVADHALTPARVVQYTYDADGNLVMATNARGATKNYFYDDPCPDPWRRHLLTRIERPEGNNYLTITYDSLGRLANRQDGEGNPVTTNYNAPGSTSVEDGGATFTYMHDAATRAVTQVSGPSRQVDYEYADTWNPTLPTRIVDGKNSEWLYEYDPRGNLLKLTAPGIATDPQQVATCFLYNQGNMPIERKDDCGGPDERVYTYTYESPATNGRLTGTNLTGVGPLWSITNYPTGDPNAGLPHQVTRHIDATTTQTTTYTYDAYGYPDIVTDALSGVTNYDFDGAGRLRFVTDANSHTREYEYDADDNLTRIVPPAPYTTEYIQNDYDDDDRLIARTDGNGHQTAYTYYLNDRLHQVIPPAPFTAETTTYTYDARGNRTGETDGNGHQTTYQYDEWDQLTLVRDAEGHETHYQYDANGNRTHGIVGNNPATVSAYDARNQLVSVTDPLSNVTSYEYDRLGRRTRMTDANNNPTETSYDALDLPTAITDTLGNTVSYTHDRAGNRLSLTDSRTPVQTWRWRYDPLNRVDQAEEPGVLITHYGYDGVGNRISKIDPKGQTILYGFDEKDRLRTVDRPGTDDVTFDYDGNDNRTQMVDANGTTTWAYDARNRLTGFTDAFNQTIGYAYDGTNNLTTLTYPGGHPVQYTYYLDDRLKTVTDWLGGQATYAYDPQTADPASLALPNGTVTTYGFDAAQRLTGLFHRRSDTSDIATFNITLMDGVGNPRTIDRVLPLEPVFSAETTDYAYGPDNRILSRTVNGSPYDYLHDNNGNRISEEGPVGLTTYVWDAEDRLVQVNEPGGNVVTHTYDGLGNRIARTENGATTRYVVDLSGDLSQLLIEADNLGTPQAYYVYGAGLLWRIDASGQRQVYHYDTVGTTVGLTDGGETVTDAYAYDAFGRVMNERGVTPNPFKFVAQSGVMDEGNNRHFMRARVYDADPGRFLSKDPLAFWARDPSLYAYADGNPVNWIDPEGRKAEPPWRRWVKKLAQVVIDAPGKLIGYGVRAGVGAIFGESAGRSAECLLIVPEAPTLLGAVKILITTEEDKRVCEEAIQQTLTQIMIDAQQYAQEKAKKQKPRWYPTRFLGLDKD